MSEYETKDEQRAAVLRFHYGFNEQHPGGVADNNQAAKALGLDGNAVLEAQLYLIDRGMLHSKPGAQLRGGDTPGVQALFARITSDGMDFVEHPTEWRGRGVPEALIKFVAQNLNFAAGDQQIVGRDVSGILAQGSATVQLPPFPLAGLREAVAGNVEGLAAIDAIDAELKSPKPAWQKIIVAADVVKSTAKVATAAQLLHDWFASPAVAHAISQAIHTFF